MLSKPVLPLLGQLPLMRTRRSRRTVPADDVQDHDEVVIFEVGHVRPQQVGLHFQLDVLWGDGRKDTTHTSSGRRGFRVWR